MKLIHLGDLHIGKVLLEQSLLEDQKYMLNQIIKIIQHQKIDAVLISGDVYDKSIPNIDAVEILNDFLIKLINELNVKVFIISGNHDSKTRLNFGSKLFEKEGLYIETNYNGILKKIELDDEGNKVNIYMLPFIKPAEIRPFFQEEIKDYNDAIRLILSKEKINQEETNIIMAHQFITYNGENPEICESENINIGTIDNVDANLFFDFDYVALGHLHGPQRIGKDTIRYSGTMLKYSFSEINHKKSVVIIDIKNKKDLTYELIQLNPKRDLREIKGPIDELIKKENYEGTNTDDYIKAIITDEEPGYEPLARIRTVYPNTLKLEIRNSKTNFNNIQLEKIEKLKEKSILELFNDFYKFQNNVEMTKKEEKIIKDIIAEIKEGEE